MNGAYQKGVKTMDNDNKKKDGMSTGSLTGAALEVDDILADAEEWSPVETKLVVWSFAIAAVALIVGLIIVPTSILH